MKEFATEAAALAHQDATYKRTGVMSGVMQDRLTGRYHLVYEPPEMMLTGADCLWRDDVAPDYDGKVVLAVDEFDERAACDSAEPLDAYEPNDVPDWDIAYECDNDAA